MTTIAVSELRANLMQVLEQIKQGAQIQITSRGKVVAQLVPADEAQEQAKIALKQLAEDAKIGNMIDPIDESWSAVAE